MYRSIFDFKNFCNYSFLRFIFSVFLVICFFQTAFPQVFFKNYESFTADNGLPHNSVFSTFQDSYGFLWISTADGLVRYDGKKFVNYLPDLENKKSIAGAHFCYLTQNNKNEVWIVHNKGISVYNHSKDEFKNILINNTLYDTRNVLIGFDNKNYLWALILNVGLVKIDIEKKEIVQIVKVPSLYVNQKITSILGLGVIRNNKIFFCLPDSLFSFNITDNKFTSIFSTSNGYLRSILNYNDSTFVFLGYNQLSLQCGTNTQIISINQFLPSGVKVINLMHYLSENDSLAYLSGSMGFVEVNKRTFLPVKIHKSLLINNVATDIMAMHSLKDRFGNYWISTNGQGLIKVPYNKKTINDYPLQENSNVVKAIKANNEFAFFGYYNNGLSVYNRKTKVNKHYTEKEYAIDKALSQERSVVAIEIIDSNNVMFSTASQNGIYIYNYRTGKFSNLLNKVEKLVSINNKQNTLGKIVLKLKNGKILFNRNFDLFLYNAKTGSVSVFAKITNQNLSCCYEDDKGGIWLGTTAGLLYMASRDTLFYKVKLPNEVTVKCINQDNKNNYWISTVNGVYVMDANHAIKNTYSTKNGLVNSYVYGIVKDKNGNLWLSHNKGISKFNFKTKEFLHFNTRDGLQGNEFNTNAFCVTESGELFFGGNGGINSFYPKHMASQDLDATCRLAEIKVGDKMFLSDSSIWTKTHLILEPGNNTVSFTMYGDDFRITETTQYKYYLEGFESEWINNGNNNFIRYPNLPPGNYLLKYKCTNGDSKWPITESSLRITLLPFWYQTALFKLVLWVFLLSALLYIMRSIIRTKERKQKQKLLELQKIQDERTRISRDLHDNVGSMVSFITSKTDWILKNSGSNLEINKDLAEVKVSANEVMSSLRETLWTLNTKKITNIDLVDKLKVYIKKHLLINHKINDLVIDEFVLSNEVVLALYRCVQELVNNTNKHSKASKVKIEFSATNACKLMFMISDNGVGFESKEKEENYGLRNIKNRLKEINAIMKIDTKIGEGTSVIITYE